MVDRAQDRQGVEDLPHCQMCTPPWSRLGSPWRARARAPATLLKSGALPACSTVSKCSSIFSRLSGASPVAPWASSRGRPWHNGWDLQLAEQMCEPRDVLINDV